MLNESFVLGITPLIGDHHDTVSALSRSSQRPSVLVYHIQDCWISNCKLVLENWLRIHLSYFLCSQPRLNKVKNLAILEVEIRGNWAMKRAISSNFSGYICKLHTLDSGINIGLRLLIFGFFSRGYCLTYYGLKRLKFY